MAALSEWIAANAASVRVSGALDPVSDKSKDSCGEVDRTIYAISDVSKGDVLVELQRDAILNSASWLASLAEGESRDVSSEFDALQLSATVRTVLSLLAVKARGEESKFAGYIKQLPAHVPLPLTWDATSKALLRDTAAQPIIDDDLVESLYQRFAKQLSVKFPTIWPEAQLELEDFHWAYAMVSSRAFSIDGADGVTLLPVIDMANHDPADPAAVIQRDSEGVYTLVAIRAVPTGSSVTISYGDFSNAQLLCRYGFTLPTAKAADTILLSSAQVRMVYAQLGGGGSVEGALLQLESSAAHDRATPSKYEDDASDSPVTKRRKLFPKREPVGVDDGILFTLHGDASREFGLSDGLTSFLFAQALPLELLYDVLSVLLQHKDKLYSALLNRNDDAAGESMNLARALAAHERQVCRRILLGIMNLEKDSDSEDSEDDLHDVDDEEGSDDDDEDEEE